MTAESSRKLAAPNIEVRILEALRGAGGTLTRTELRQAIRLGVRSSDLDRAIDALTQRKELMTRHVQREVGRGNGAKAWVAVTVYRLVSQAKKPLPFPARTARPDSRARDPKSSITETAENRMRRIVVALKALGGTAQRNLLREHIRPTMTSADFDEAIGRLVRDSVLIAEKVTDAWRSPRGKDIPVHRFVYTLAPSRSTA